MDTAGSRVSRNLVILLTVLAAAIVVWFVLKFLLRFVPWLALPLLLLTAIFLIVLVLIQRGKGGGLAGAFGGLGGQSAFGTKAGDLFTRVTIGAALFWILLCMATVNVLGTAEDMGGGDVGAGAPAGQESPAPAPGGPAGSGAPHTPAGDAAPSGGQDGGS